MSLPLPVINLSTATFECVYGRGCDGICCRESEPPVSAEEIARLQENLPAILPHLRPEARAIVESAGFLGGEHDNGEQKLALADRWCVFFNAGCVLHKLGSAEGDPYRYKPLICALFPLEDGADGQWRVRQWGEAGEEWDLFCLNPAQSAKPAAESLQAEMALLQDLRRHDRETAVLPFADERPRRESA